MKKLGSSVLDESITRLRSLYKDSSCRPVVAFSGGKDATAVLELAIIAAQSENRLPIDVSFIDFEILVPGTHSYIRRTAQRKEVNLVWFYGYTPQPTVLDRECPFWWTFDPLYSDRWLSDLPDNALRSDEKYLRDVVTVDDFPAPFPEEFETTCDYCQFEQPVLDHSATSMECSNCHRVFKLEPLGNEDRGDTISLLGMRSGESANRRLITLQRGGFMALRRNANLSISAWPIYDWSDGDVWRAIRDNGWDYNSAYDDMIRARWPKHAIRIGDMTVGNAESLRLSVKTWPSWYERVCDRISGARALSTRSSLMPEKKEGETWKSYFIRHCLKEAPQWIRERAEKCAARVCKSHEGHAGKNAALPDSKGCMRCAVGSNCWKALATKLYTGDPWGGFTKLEEVDPMKFRSIIEKRVRG